MTQNTNQETDVLENFYVKREENIENNNTNTSNLNHTHATESSNETIMPKTQKPLLFSSDEIFADLPSYFKESHDYLTDIFTKLGDGSITSSLSYEERNELLKNLEDYKEDMIETVQKATVQLSEDISKIKRLKVKSNVDTTPLKNLVYGSSGFKNEFDINDNLFVDPDNK